MRRTNILACLLLAAASCLPFQPWLDRSPSGCALELRVTSDESGLMRLYYDVGRGFVDADASVQPVFAGKGATVRFALPHGTFRAFRLDPLDRDARMTLAGARVIGPGGRILEAFSAGQFHPNYQIEFMEAKGDSLVMRTTPDARYPRLTLDPVGKARRDPQPLLGAGARCSCSSVPWLCWRSWILRSVHPSCSSPSGWEGPGRAPKGPLARRS